MKKTTFAAKAAFTSLIAAGAIGIALPQAAMAAKPIKTGPPACDTALVGAQSCSGYYEGNLNGGSPAKIEAQQVAVAALGANYTFDGNFGDLAKTTTLTGGSMIDFGTMLFGETIVSIHFGNVAGPGGNVTGFYLFDFGTTGASSITLANTQGFSNAVLYTTGTIGGAVPEPATWALFLIAFGAMGFAMRMRNTKTDQTATVTYA
ncbi:PEP-CTERM sorting domain-containing protein [Erythrobacter litoralis]|uniref:PEP-CTERM sorting domain-containing protein n=1 Tax=Erythrobacter litoralis TaxID=39960 RepID=UPI0024355DC3|nr:PEP-CTERM sorting domain-containing protein [Erythrobacter litoralis]MDG6079084.1 PEP-CTERM sorting domain-containing protein [Erythrobacter litoralis]